MRILAIYRHYWPDATPYAKILRTLLEHLAAQQHEVVVYTAQPSYNDIRQAKRPWRENVNGVTVIRVPLLPERKRWTIMRGINACLFLLRVVIHTMTRRQYDLVIANTFPPILNGIALRMIRRLRGTEYVYHCQDIHPESARVIGKVKRNWIYKLLLSSDTKTCKVAKRLVVLSTNMRDSLISRGIPAAQITVINNPPVDGVADSNGVIPNASHGESDSFQILFAGNIGLAQGLDAVIKSAHLLSDEPRIRFTLMGEGGAKRQLTEMAAQLIGKTVFFVPFQPIESAFAAMQAADFGLVSLQPDLYRFAFPSKTMTYLAAGCPVLAMVEDESDLAATIRVQRIGYVVSCREPSAIAETIRVAFAERNQWTPERRGEVRQVCQKIYGRDRFLREWDCLIQGLE